MNGYFWIDRSRDCKVTYSRLIKDLNAKTHFNKYIRESNPYEIYLNLLLGIINQENVVLLDSDFSKEELSSLGMNDEEIRSVSITNRADPIENINDLLVLIDKSNSDFNLSLYTSGTSGRPKRVSHQLGRLLRTVTVKDKFIGDVWALAYNPTHFAGLQVFFQAIRNTNTLVYLFDCDKEALLDSFIEEGITRISATPTFYRNILPLFKNEMASVKSVTSGGEKFDPNISKFLEKVFPNATIKNVYASTEAGSLFASDGDSFIVPDSIGHQIMISPNQELWIHRSLIGDSEEIQFEGDYYNTKDIVEFIDGNKFKFVSRNSDFINVGGYRVNSTEIEELIAQLEIVKDVLVYGRKNSVTGNVIVADLVKADPNIPDKEFVRTVSEYINGKLQAWKIPRMYYFVERLQKTRTGKKVRHK